MFVFVCVPLLFSVSQAGDLWQQLELAFGVESDLRDTGLGQEVAC